jgi:hypothetical protein
VFVYIPAEIPQGESLVKSVEKAVRSQIRGFGVEVGSNTLAAVAVDLARRLDAGPGDRNAVGLAHELRMLFVELRRQTDIEGTSDVEAFLERVANPDLGHAAH